LERAGGPSALTDIYGHAVSPIYFRAHLKQVSDKFILRRQIQVCTAGIAAAYDAPGEAMEGLDTLERDVLAIRDASEATTPAQTLRDSVDAFLADLDAAIRGKESLPGLTTGFDELDRKTNGGMKPGDMFVLAARPSMGKTSLMMNIVVGLFRRNEPESACKPPGVIPCQVRHESACTRLRAKQGRFAAHSAGGDGNGIGQGQTDS
jgi:replicative DNA helicase